MLLSTLVQQHITEYNNIRTDVYGKLIDVPSGMSIFLEEQDTYVSPLELVKRVENNSLTPELTELKNKIVTDLSLFKDKLNAIITGINVENNSLYKELHIAEQTLLNIWSKLNLDIPELKINKALCINRKHFNENIYEDIQSVCKSMNLISDDTDEIHIYYNNEEHKYLTVVTELTERLKVKHSFKYDILSKYIKNSSISLDPRNSSAIVYFLKLIGK
jgi:hypothetical protein